MNFGIADFCSETLPYTRLVIEPYMEEIGLK